MPDNDFFDDERVAGRPIPVAPFVYCGTIVAAFLLAASGCTWGVWSLAHSSTVKPAASSAPHRSQQAAAKHAQQRHQP